MGTPPPPLKHADVLNGWSLTWLTLTWISTWPFRPWKPLFPPIILGLKIRPKTAAAALFDELLAGGELSLSGSWVSSSGRTRCSRSSSRCSFYNKFITCFHESWIYETFFFHESCRLFWSVFNEFLCKNQDRYVIKCQYNSFIERRDFFKTS